MRWLNFYNAATQQLQRLQKRKHVKYGVPFVLLLVIGSFGIEKFASLRYEFRRNETLKPENLEKLGIKKKKVVLEEEYEEYKKIDIDSWENIRGPRPWEESQQAPKTS
ncbi:cytochrome c oxidase assembly protein COX16 homolog, mitochondrial-like [Uloborus diversus]|uniref:cytochrome c oxidase assembly protein COX16 homolog, mitochondrial-like n=1 Tax=Uloborus diversus TaxID=327109 RepID=UPI00240A5C8B|nr:cytochrome c oxidase assembly protein COX16 homolog, mitochondrial-like [Uloborus diversus]